MTDQHDVAAINAKLDSLIGSFGDMKDVVSGMAEKIEKVAVLEESHARTKVDVDRSFNMMRQIDSRVQQIEVKLPVIERSSSLFDSGMKWMVYIVGLAILYQLFGQHFMK